MCTVSVPPRRTVVCGLLGVMSYRNGARGQGPGQLELEVMRQATLCVVGKGCESDWCASSWDRQRCSTSRGRRMCMMVLENVL